MHTARRCQRVAAEGMRGMMMPLIYLSEDSIVAASAALLLVTKKDDFMGGPTLGELVNIERAFNELNRPNAPENFRQGASPLPELWSDNRIAIRISCVKFQAKIRPDECVVVDDEAEFAMIQIRDEYEGDRQRLIAENADLTAKLRRAYHENTVLVAALDEEDDDDE